MNCIENDYMLYTTKEDKEFYDMMCGDVEHRRNSYERAYLFN